MEVRIVKYMLEEMNDEVLSFIYFEPNSKIEYDVNLWNLHHIVFYYSLSFKY